jgi:hypothetical protein
MTNDMLGKRRIIQVATDSSGVIVLCSDGSLWSLPEDGEDSPLRKPEWHRLPPIPQDEA